MKDFLGNELQVGDEIVYVDGAGQGSYLHIAIVDSFTPKMVNILKVRPGQYRYYSPSGFVDFSDRIKVGPYTGFQEARVTPQKIIKAKHNGVNRYAT